MSKALLVLLAIVVMAAGASGSEDSCPCTDCRTDVIPQGMTMFLKHTCMFPCSFRIETAALTPLNYTARVVSYEGLHSTYEEIVGMPSILSSGGPTRCFSATFRPFYETPIDVALLISCPASRYSTYLSEFQQRPPETFAGFVSDLEMRNLRLEALRERMLKQYALESQPCVVKHSFVPLKGEVFYLTEIPL